MKAFAITTPGLESYAAQEIEELLKTKTKTEDSVILFDADEQQLAYLSYRAQSLIKVCSLFETFKLDSADDLQKIKTDFTKIIKKGKTFRAKFSRQGDVDLSAQEIEPMLGEQILEQFTEQPKVSMGDPDYIIYLYACNDAAYLGLDYCGFDLGKRDYRVFANPKSLHAHISYLLLRIAEFKENETLLDPFCLSGEVGIEAALLATRRSPYFFAKQKFAFTKFMSFDFEKVDKEMQKSKATIVVSSPHMSDVRAAQKNAKIAGVEKEIDFTRQDIEWLDFKFKEKESVDKIVTTIICPSSTMAESVLKKIYEDFFYQIKYGLSKKGKAVVLGKNLFYFKSLVKDAKVTKSLQCMNGKEQLDIVILEKK
jgi:23S rRNA G2445 N2-methylase RlmL